jgi:hypothetical protein
VDRTGRRRGVDANATLFLLPLCAMDGHHTRNPERPAAPTSSGEGVFPGTSEICTASGGAVVWALRVLDRTASLSLERPSMTQCSGRRRGAMQGLTGLGAG